MLRTIVYVGFGCVIAWAVIYPFWTSSNALVSQYSSSSTTAFFDFFTMPYGEASDDILTAGIDPFAPEFTDDYPVPDFASFTDVKVKKNSILRFYSTFS